MHADQGVHSAINDSEGVKIKERAQRSVDMDKCKHCVGD